MGLCWVVSKWRGSYINQQMFTVQTQKEVKDKKGRLVIILADIEGQTLILTKVYAPNANHFFIDFES